MYGDDTVIRVISIADFVIIAIEGIQQVSVSGFVNVSDQVLGTNFDIDGISKAVIAKIVIEPVVGDLRQQVGLIVLITDRYGTGTAQCTDFRQKIIVRVISVTCLISLGISDRVNETGNRIDAVSSDVSALIGSRGSVIPVTAVSLYGLQVRVSGNCGVDFTGIINDTHFSIYHIPLAIVAVIHTDFGLFGLSGS